MRPRDQNLFDRYAKDQTVGFVFATTGEKYTVLARRAARSLLEQMPTAQIDLFTDQNVQDDVFRQVIQLQQHGRRPKIEALQRSQFEKTIYLDADTMVIFPIWDLFELLEKNDVIATQARANNNGMSHHDLTKDIPASFPMVNSGVLGLRKSEEASKLLQLWQARWDRSAQQFDQPFLRYALYKTDARLGIFPMEYNMLWHHFIHAMDDSNMAPRVIHNSQLHQREFPGNAEEPYTLAEVLPKKLERRVRKLIASDQTMHARSTKAVHALSDVNAMAHLTTALRRRVKKILRLQKKR